MTNPSFCCQEFKFVVLLWLALGVVSIGFVSLMKTSNDSNVSSSIEQSSHDLFCGPRRAFAQSRDRQAEAEVAVYQVFKYDSCIYFSLTKGQPNDVKAKTSQPAISDNKFYSYCLVERSFVEHTWSIYQLFNGKYK